MATPFIGEIRMFAGSFAPVNFLLCNGSIVSISDYETLYALIGTTYGGDGQSTFGLPDLRGRIPIHMGTGAGQPSYALGQNGGQETVTLTVNQLGTHTHTFAATTAAATAKGPAAGYLANDPALPLYTADTANLVALAPSAIGTAGSGTPAHNNIMPYQCLNFIIAYNGTFPTSS